MTSSTHTTATIGASSLRRVAHAAGWLGARLSGVLAFCVLGEVLVRSEVIPSRYLPPPTEVAAEVVRMMLDGPELWTMIGETAQGWFAGIVIAALIAGPLGVLLGTLPMVHRAFNPLLEFLRPIPPVALIPVAILMYGMTRSLVVFLVVIGATWPLLIQTMYGVRDVDPVARDMSRSYRLSFRAQILEVVLPGTLPFLMTGLRLAVTVGLVIAVSAEFIVGVKGLGSEIMLAYQAGNVLRTYALVVVAGIVGMLVSLLFHLIDRRVLRWHPSVRGDEVAA